MKDSEGSDLRLPPRGSITAPQAHDTAKSRKLSHQSEVIRAIGTCAVPQWKTIEWIRVDSSSFEEEEEEEEEEEDQEEEFRAGAGGAGAGGAAGAGA